MVSAIKAARKAAREAIESLYDGACTVIELKSVKDEKTKITSAAETVVLENEPCRLSFESLSATAPSDTAASVAQGVKLFLAPETEVKCGSKVIVTQSGATAEYAVSGKSAVYPTHQEIRLETFREWA